MKNKAFFFVLLAVGIAGATNYFNGDAATSESPANEAKTTVAKVSRNAKVTKRSAIGELSPAIKGARGGGKLIVGTVAATAGNGGLDLIDFSDISDTTLTTVNGCDAPIIHELNINVKLEGAMEFGETFMRSTLYDVDVLPIDQPYGAKPWNYFGNESLQYVPQADSQKPVDWVLVQVRIGSTIYTKAAILQASGKICAPDCPDRGLSFPALVQHEGFYDVAVRHRNHLDIRFSAETPSPEFGEFWDLQDEIIYHNISSYPDASLLDYMLEIEPGLWVMYGGDGLPDSVTNAMDYNLYKQTIADIFIYSHAASDFSFGNSTSEVFAPGSTWMLSPDYDLNATVNGLDFSLWKKHNAKLGMTIW